VRAGGCGGSKSSVVSYTVRAYTQTKSRGDTAVLFRCEPVEAAAAEFSRRVDGEVLTVEERRRRCVDETQRVAAERRQFVDTVEKTADVIRQTVSHVVTWKPSQ